MRRTAALIVGGGPAGSAAAICLARSGLEPELIERRAGPHDVVCGGFLSWDSLAALERLGIDPWVLGAQPIERVRFVSGRRVVETRLPDTAAGLSRRILDGAMLGAAAGAGARLRRGSSVKALEGLRARLDDAEEIEAEAVFLATGKYELRGAARAGAGIEAAPVGLRTSISADPSLKGVIELHLFDGGYAGLLLQEDGMANLCMSVSRNRLGEAGGVEQLMARLAADAPALASRMGDSSRLKWSAVAGVPYGWRAGGGDGLFRIGDQGAVIASLAGDGIAIALTSGIAAAAALCEHGPAGARSYQARFAGRAALPVRLGEALRWAAERRLPRAALLRLLAFWPGLVPLAARLTRVG